MKNISIDDLKSLVESILKIKGGKGYSVGHPYKEFSVKPVYGKSEYSYEKENSKNIDDQKPQPVEISRAFSGRKSDDR